MKGIEWHWERFEIFQLIYVSLSSSKNGNFKQLSWKSSWEVENNGRQTFPSTAVGLFTPARISSADFWSSGVVEGLRNLDWSWKNFGISENFNSESTTSSMRSSMSPTWLGGSISKLLTCSVFSSSTSCLFRNSWSRYQRWPALCCVFEPLINSG